MRMFASFIHAEALNDDVEPLVFAEALRLAEQQNTTLSVQDAVTESAQLESAISRSFLFPKINFDLAHLETDARLAITTAGLATDGSTRGLLGLDQLIYDDRAMSDYKRSKRLAESSGEERETVRLDVLADAGRAYLNMSLAQVILAVDAYRVIMFSKEVPREDSEKLGFIHSETIEDAITISEQYIKNPSVNIVPSGGVIIPDMR